MIFFVRVRIRDFSFRLRTHDFLFQIESRVKSALQSSIDGFYAGDTGTDAVSLGFNFLFITVSPPTATVQSFRLVVRSGPPVFCSLLY